MTYEDEPAVADLDLPGVLAALADPGRLATVRALSRQPSEIGCAQLQTAAGLDLTKSTMSHHLKVLREAGVTHTRVIGVHRYVSLRRDDLEQAFPGLLGAVIGAAAMTSTTSSTS
jgi:DNA-binding transcriptional ArsR family regulator